jgi:ABC-type phosphate/phosphonate transport system substrate-binding protein
MIANARMYSVSPEAASLWRKLLAGVIEHAGLDIEVVEHTAPKPLDELWRRCDMAAVFMCGLPFSRAEPQPALIAAPVPAPPEFRGRPEYWSEMVVRKDSPFERLEDTFGRRLALTAAGSQSGCIAPLTLLRQTLAAEAGPARANPVYDEVIGPEITPLAALSAVVEGRAEVAPVDAYAFALLQRYRRDLTAAVRSIARTRPTPIPPLVASAPGLDALRKAFVEAHRVDALRPLMTELLLERFVHPEPRTYDALRSNYESITAYWREHALARRIGPAFAHF